MTPLTADELVILMRARDLLYAKINSSDNASAHRVEYAHSALLDVLRHAVLDTRDEAPKDDS